LKIFVKRGRKRKKRRKSGRVLVARFPLSLSFLFSRKPVRIDPKKTDKRY